MKYLFLSICICITCTSFAQGRISGATYEKQQVYRYVAQMPHPDYDFNKYIKDNMRYPEEARKKGEKGRIFVDFVIQTNGEPASISVRNAYRYPLLAEEAKRLISTMPKWRPGMKDGKAVNVMQTKTIIFIP